MYSYVRYIGYDIATVARRPKVAAPKATSDWETLYSAPAGSLKNPPRLFDLENETAQLSDDAKVRIQRLIGVILGVAKRIKVTDSDRTLKVFIAPEFYFRPPNSDWAYTMDEYRRIKTVLRTTINAYEELTHWMIIPGTILWKMDKGDALKSKRKIDPKSDKVIHFNSALYIKRTLNPFVRQTKVIEKFAASHIDGFPVAKSAPKEYPRYQSAAKVQKHMFTLNGVKFGLEICLEHGYRAPDPAKKFPGMDVRILKNFIAKYPDSAYVDGVDLHLLTAGGMPLVPQSAIAKAKGYIFRADGYVSLSKPATEIQKINAYTGTKKPSDLTGTAQLEDLSPNFLYIDIKNDKYFGQFYQPAPGGCENYWRPQKISISKVCKLP